MQPAALARSVARRSGFTRARVAATRMRCERAALAAIPRAPVDRPRILCYHSVGTPEWGVNDVEPRAFFQQVKWARQNGYTFVPARDIAEGNAPPKSLAITFDDGLASIANIVPALRLAAIPWTVFVVSDWADGRSRWSPDTFLGWSELERMAAGGATIGSHSVTHPDFGTLAPDQIDHELGEARRVIGARLGIEPTEFAIPFGTRRRWTDVAQKASAIAGYDVVYAQADDRCPPGTIPRTFITRFDGLTQFRAALSGRFDRWEEWV